MLQCLIHDPDDDWGGVKGGQRAGAGSGIFVLVKQGFQFQIFAVTLVKAVGQTAPAYILGQHFLLLQGSQTVLGFDLFQAADGGHIGGVFLTGSAVAQLIVCDPEVPARICRDFRVQGGEHHTLPFGLRRGKGCWFFFFRLFSCRLCNLYRSRSMGTECILGFLQCFKTACSGSGNAGLCIVAVVVIILAVGIALDDDGFLL